MKTIYIVLNVDDEEIEEIVDTNNRSNIRWAGNQKSGLCITYILYMDTDVLLLFIRFDYSFYIYDLHPTKKNRKIGSTVYIPCGTETTTTQHKIKK
mmetsp:Transcript_17668/g.20232  ORF Transcript_17668/g.20232 Transcript_17668/m.20232 type:complete len:96 (+) Transcript_17668:745-1032(+)